MVDSGLMEFGVHTYTRVMDTAGSLFMLRPSPLMRSGGKELLNDEGGWIGPAEGCPVCWRI